MLPLAKFLNFQLKFLKFNESLKILIIKGVACGAPGPPSKINGPNWEYLLMIQLMRVFIGRKTKPMSKQNANPCWWLDNPKYLFTFIQWRHRFFSVADSATAHSTAAQAPQQNCNLEFLDSQKKCYTQTPNLLKNGRNYNHNCHDVDFLRKLLDNWNWIKNEKWKL